MNNVLRHEIFDIIDLINNLIEKIKCGVTEDKCADDVDYIYNRIINVQCDEQESMSNIPESFQNSDRYHKAEEAIDNMDNALDCIEYDVDSLRDAISFLNDCI